jgi:hypothetical protein
MGGKKVAWIEGRGLGSKWTVRFLIYLEIFKKTCVFPLLENFKIKYGIEAFEMRNNFHYWNFSNFRIEFELKIKETLGFKVWYNLMDFNWNFQELMNFEDTSTQEKEFGVSDLWVSQFTSRIWFELAQNLTLIYLELS